MSVKKHRPIRLPANPPRKIPQIVKELVKAMNQQQTDVRSFATSQKISFSKVYNWIAGKAEPKRNSTDIILRYFKKIKYDYVPIAEKQSSVKTGKLLPARIDPSLAANMKLIVISLKEQSELLKFLLELVEKLTKNGERIPAAVKVKKAVRVRKKEM
ncbi:hypothetical protein [Pseudobacter ginsenosidimutans]|uniref:Uncharacterized protein n=1 Tax=Pseudobacter ginsenosidimutans TaxID=661488 RepID=A0A4Q7N2J6_9BACT|nr:hypothetical protein [Pseudobacter ginsenosidimutans]QEC43654.1 hypothetical protein FSB84_18925 [Pseudobacter ginsenosidimutans]RZS75054.1 hypothetical protein EV199_0912 [Pseudobacter ginsenosidimutans]